MDDATTIEPKETPPLSQAELDALTDKLIEKLKTVYDRSTSTSSGSSTRSTCPTTGTWPST
jgi:hypothetical protein